MIPPVLSVFTGVTLSPGAQALVSAETPRSAADGGHAAIWPGKGDGHPDRFTLALAAWTRGEQDQAYERFWTQLLSWLLPREEAGDKMRLELFADRDQLFLGESIELHARLGAEEAVKPDSVEARITLPDGREIPYRMAPQLVTTPSGKTFPGFGLPFVAEQAGQHKVVATAKLKGGWSSGSHSPFL